MNLISACFESRKALTPYVTVGDPVPSTTVPLMLHALAEASSDGATAAAVAKVADGVVVGSALVRQLAEHAEPSQATAAIVNLLKDMRGAMDR